MQKFVTVVKHEYKKVVLKWSFLIATLLLPVFAGLISVIPTVIFSIKSEPTRIAVVDPTTKILPRLERNLHRAKLSKKEKQAAGEQKWNASASQEEMSKQNATQFTQDFRLIPVPTSGRDADAVRSDLLKSITSDEIDAYLFIPEAIEGPNAVFEYRSRKGGDFISNDAFLGALNDAVRSQRLADANISEERVADLSAKLNVDSKGIDDRGVEKNNLGTFVASFIIGLMIYLLLAIYGQQIMGAVVEEKETRIAEILFSSARPFELILGKLVGVGLAGLTQLSIWVVTAGGLIGLVVAQGSLGTITESIPTISPLMVFGFLVYFLLGFFIYASIFALIGSMVTTVQEGSQFAIPPILLMLAAFYFCFAVIRDPNSTLSFWVSMLPFLAPITMPVRMLAEMPPLWQIALSVSFNIVGIAVLVWIAARAYRVGMLMYGKRATIPEVWKWIRQT